MPEGTSSPSHEPSDISLRAAVWFAFFLVVGFVAIAVLVAWMQHRLDHSGVAWPHQPHAAEPQFQPPSPTLQTSSAEDLKTFREEEAKALQSYGWMDRKAGVVRIPQQRARDLILQRGLPETGTAMPLPGPHPLPGEAPQPNQLPVKGGAQ